MKIVRGTSIEVSKLTEAVSVLFCLRGGAYYYVSSGVIENELRVMKNWQVGEQAADKPWLTTWQQGVQIPQELGDYLIITEKIRTEAQKVVDNFAKMGRYQDQRLGHGLEAACKNWDEASDVGGMIDFSGLIQVLSVHQDNDQTTNSSEQTENQTNS